MSTLSTGPTFHVDSEVGPLRQVIVHRPGLELARLTPDNVHELLFDDVMWAARACNEHDAFAAQLRQQGVHVHHFGQLFAEALDAPGARAFVQEELTTATRFGPALDRPLDDLVATAPARTLAELLVGGVLKRDVADLLHTSSLLMEYLDADDFLLRPLPNHLFQRDNSAWIYGGLSINPMAKQARRRETINSRVVYNFHPMFRKASVRFLYGNDALDHGPATVEGGDILILGNGVVMVGMGERTTPQGAESLARALFVNGEVSRVVAVELPKTRAFTHLDTAMTMVDRDAFSAYPYLPDNLRSFTLTHVGDRAEYKVEENAALWPVVAEALQVDGSGCCERLLTGAVPNASSGTTGTTSSPLRPASCWATSATPPRTFTWPTKHHGGPGRRLGARTWSWRASVHDLSDRT